MEKVIKDGMVAVLVSPGYGAGWSTWERSHQEAMCMDARLVNAFIDGGPTAVADAAKELIDPHVYTGGAEDLEIEWVPQGSMFEIEEYDGSESLHIIGQREYLVA